ncbi:hypothetical protein KAR91_70330 [Candidatus Pacearchaeota archaeon]|nr:hypothetical protein [Candidatus Pacearchaeota archaeon]
MIENAKISSTQFGYVDGRATSFINLEVGGSGWGFGGRALANQHCFGYISGILKAVGVNTWEGLSGTLIRVKSENDMITAIGHIMEDKWFDAEEYHQQCLKKESCNA